MGHAHIRNYSLSTWDSNLTGHPALLFAKSGDPIGEYQTGMANPSAVWEQIQVWRRILGITSTPCPFMRHPSQNSFSTEKCSLI